MKMLRLAVGALALAIGTLAIAPAMAQSNPGTSPLSIAKGGTGAATASAARANLGLTLGSAVQAWDADLDALAALAGTNTIYYRSGIATWSAVTIGGLLSFSGGTLNVGDAELVALAGLTSAADKCAYFTGSGTAALTDCPSFGRSLMNAASASAARTTLGLVPGTDVQAFDAELAALAGLTSVNNKCFYFTGTGTAATYDCSSFGRGLVNAATAAAARASAQLNVESFTGRGDANYTIVATDRTVGTNAAFTASRTFTLPAANAVNPGQDLIVADFQGTVTASNTLVITRAGADTVNGGTSVTITAANGAYLLKSDGTSKWTAQALGAAAAGGVSSVTCNGGLTGGTITTSGTCAPDYATKSEQETGTSTAKVVNPSNQKNHDSAAKGWIYVTQSAGTYTTQSSYNMSASKNSTGNLTLTFSTAFASANYTLLCTASEAGSYNVTSSISSSSAATVVLRNSTSGSQLDVSFACVAFGRQ